MHAVATETTHALEGRTDAEILSWIDSVGGSEVYLAEVFAGMSDAFQADRAEGQSGVIQWDVESEAGTATYQVEIAAGRCKAHLGTPLEPRVTLKLALSDFLRLVMGTLDGREAYRAGTLGIVGDTAFADAISGWFVRAG